MQEKVGQDRQTPAISLEPIGTADEDEIEEVLDDMFEGCHPVELSSDPYAAWMTGNDGTFILGYYPKLRTIREMVKRGLVFPGLWHRKAIAGTFNKRLFYLTLNHDGRR